MHPLAAHCEPACQAAQQHLQLYSESTVAQSDCEPEAALPLKGLKLS